jgi:hypothetical protein
LGLIIYFLYVSHFSEQQQDFLEKIETIGELSQMDVSLVNQLPININLPSNNSKVDRAREVLRLSRNSEFRICTLSV